MSKTLRRVIIIIAAVVFAVSASQIFWHYYQIYVADKSYANVRAEATTDEPAVTLPAADTFSTISIDFAALHAINPDIIAWLYIPDTPVSYPILQGASNQTYLRTTYEKKSNILGSIFMDYRNNKEFTDWNTIIYGHNTSNDSMFGSLKKYKQQDYADQHLYVQIIRENQVRVYEIFSIYETLATSDTYTIKFSSTDSYKSYLDKMALQTLLPSGEPPDMETIVTLSTCTGGEKTMRLVLQAKLVELHEYGSGGGYGD